MADVDTVNKLCKSQRARLAERLAELQRPSWTRLPAQRPVLPFPRQRATGRTLAQLLKLQLCRTLELCLPPSARRSGHTRRVHPPAPEYPQLPPTPHTLRSRMREDSAALRSCLHCGRRRRGAFILQVHQCTYLMHVTRPTS